MQIGKQSIPVKYFVFFIIGLLILNFIVSVYIPFLEFESLNRGSQYTEVVFYGKTAWFLTTWFLVAPTGLVLIPGFLLSPFPFNDWLFLRIIVWIFAMISIPLTIKLTHELPKVARIFLVYFVAVNIAAIGFIVWAPDFLR